MSFKIKQRVIGHYQGALGGSHWFPGRVSKVYQNGLVDIAYDDGDEVGLNLFLEPQHIDVLTFHSSSFFCY